VRGVGLVFLVVGAGILIIVFFLLTMLYAYFFGRKQRSPMYREFYECGFKATPDNRTGVDIQYSALALIFLVYDMEIILLVPLFVNLSALPVIS
jgi:NADH:ubiquinone oxidoreductase subunit 3 (subunit A)